MNSIQQVDSSTPIKTTPTILYSITLTAAAANATVQVRDGGSDGPVVLTLRALENEAAVFSPASPAALSKGLFLTLTGAGAVASVMYG